MVASVNDDGLTIKQEAFARAYFETGNAAEAYRTAYDTEPNAMDSWIYVEASQLLDHPKITTRLKQLQEEAKKLSLYTVSQAYDELEAARLLAHGEANPSAAVSAINSKMKLFGLEQPAKKRIEHTSPDGSMSPVSPADVTKEAVDELRKLLEGG
jgi:hypothetical protein